MRAANDSLLPGATRPRRTPALPPAASATPPTSGGPLADLIRRKALRCVFQPIAALRDGGVFGHEALIRGPLGHALHTPDALLEAARREDMLDTFELHCVQVALEQWSRADQAGRLFVNISASALCKALSGHTAGRFDEYLRRLGISPRLLVLEITEHERVDDMAGLLEAVRTIHASGVALALDDFGDGRSSLKLWSQLRPDFVKIDKYFTKDVSSRAENLLTLKALMHIGEIFGTALVAEGIETQADARVIRDLGISYGQGYLLGRPAKDTRDEIEAGALGVLADRKVAVFPEIGRSLNPGQLRSLSAIRAEPVGSRTSNDRIAERFLAEPELHALAVVEHDKPIAIINRNLFLNHYATPFFKELHGRKGCLSHANTSPRLIERDHDVEELVGILTSQDQRYLSDGFIVVENGRYAGLGTGEQLVRTVTEARIEAARHANTLTFLPGNIPITQHLQRLLDRRSDFVACYVDLNHFKPFNDLYGYWRGDDMIRLIARLAVTHCDSQCDFVGHVGGDDFMIVFQSEDWDVRCQRIIGEFADAARHLFDPDAQKAGGITAEDRDGVARFFPLTTVSVGAVLVEGGVFRRPEEIANAAAMAKQAAKRSATGMFVSRPAKVAAGVR